MYRIVFTVHSMETTVDALGDQLNFTELENKDIHVDFRPLEEVGFGKRGNCLVAKLHTNRTFNRDAFKITMKRN